MYTVCYAKISNIKLTQGSIYHNVYTAMQITLHSLKGASVNEDEVRGPDIERGSDRTTPSECDA